MDLFKCEWVDICFMEYYLVIWEFLMIYFGWFMDVNFLLDVFELIMLNVEKGILIIFFWYELEDLLNCVLLLDVKNNCILLEIEEVIGFLVLYF